MFWTTWKSSGSCNSRPTLGHSCLKTWDGKPFDLLDGNGKRNWSYRLTEQQVRSSKTHHGFRLVTKLHTHQSFLIHKRDTCKSERVIIRIPRYWHDKICLALQKYRQNLSLPNSIFVKRGRTLRDTAKYSLTTGDNHTEITLFGWFRWFAYRVFLVGLHRDVQIGQYLALEFQLERKLGNRNNCILSKDRHAANRGTNLPCSLYDSRANIKIILAGVGLKHYD